MIDLLTDPSFVVPAGTVLGVLIVFLGRAIHLFVKAGWARNVIDVVVMRAAQAAHLAAAEWRLRSEHARADGVVTREEFTEICDAALKKLWAGLSWQSAERAGKVFGTQPQQLKELAEGAVVAELERDLRVEPARAPIVAPAEGTVVVAAGIGR